MKYWQLTFVLRDEKTILNELRDFENASEFKNYYDNLNEIVQLQKREILDKEVPEKLVCEALSKSEKKFYVDQNLKEVYSYKNVSSGLEISILDLYKLAGADVLAELLEKTQVELNNDFVIETLQNFKRS